MTNIIEKLARAVASANGDNYSDAFANKTRWVAKRGMSGGRFRDVTEPYQHDYDDMARAVLQTLHDNITPEMVEAGMSTNTRFGPRAMEAIFQRMIQSALKGERA